VLAAGRKTGQTSPARRQPKAADTGGSSVSGREGFRVQGKPFKDKIQAAAFRPGRVSRRSCALGADHNGVRWWAEEIYPKIGDLKRGQRCSAAVLPVSPDMAVDGTVGATRCRRRGTSMFGAAH